MNDLRTLKIDEIGIENQRIRGGSELVSDRDPSFSGWYDQEEPMPSHELDEKDVFQYDFDFELPLVQQKLPNNNHLDNQKCRSNDYLQRMELGVGVDDETPNDYDPLVIDNRFKTSANSFDPTDYHTDSENPVSAAYILKTLILILIWYTVSTLLMLYNKTLLGDQMGRFPAPLLMNTIHFAMQATLSITVTRFYFTRRHSLVMSWEDYFSQVVPTALSTALDIDLSNASLVFISVTFATMCKSASPIFLLLFAFAFRLESPSVRLLGIILIISVGILLTVAKETEFDFWGFVLVMLSAVMSGFRWTMTQILLQKEVYGLKNPLTLMSYVAPVMMMATAVLSLLLDPWAEFRMSNYFNSSWHIMKSCLLMSFGGTLAFVMVLTEYILVSVTSAVTITIAGIVKEGVTILVAVLYFHDEFTWLKGVGLGITIIGVSLFNWYKYEKLRKAKVDAGSPASKYVVLGQIDEGEENL